MSLKTVERNIPPGWADPIPGPCHPVGSTVAVHPSRDPYLSAIPGKSAPPPDGARGKVIAFSGAKARVVEIVESGRRLVCDLSALSAV